MTWTQIADLTGPQGPAGYNATGAAADDAAIAAFVLAGSGATATSAAVATKTFVADSDYATLELALAAVPTGGVLEIRTAWSRATEFVIGKACTIRFVKAGAITITTGSANAISITASNVTLDSPVLVGTGTATAGTGRAISAVGTAGAPLARLTVNNPTITGFSQYGIYFEQCVDLKIRDVQINDVAYAGIMLLSCIRGRVKGGRIWGVTMPTGFTNAYGIAASRNSAQTIAVAPRSENITICGLTVEGVPWEGIDTHAGKNINVVGNTVLGCLVGIAIVPSPNTGGTMTYAPLGVKVIGNTCDSQVTDGSKKSGIQFVGAGTGAIGGTVEAGTGIISNNRILDYSGASMGGIIAYDTSGLIVAGNEIIRPRGYGIYLNGNNFGCTLTNNLIEDVWDPGSTEGYAVVLGNPGNNEVTISGTKLARGSKTATTVNARGLQAFIATGSTVLDGGGNQWYNATVYPASGATTIQKVGFYTATPVVRAGAITAPTGGTTIDSQSRTAIAAVITVLQNVGLTL